MELFGHLDQNRPSITDLGQRSVNHFPWAPWHWVCYQLAIGKKWLFLTFDARYIKRHYGVSSEEEWTAKGWTIRVADMYWPVYFPRPVKKIRGTNLFLVTPTRPFLQLSLTISFYFFQQKKKTSPARSYKNVDFFLSFTSLDPLGYKIRLIISLSPNLSK